ncbi:MAG: hypothetical protein BIFFINMI_00018 [Phycisphaerae bacterium]|nr:hypothetical protein [Phycisphaerae bacterium]
MTKELQARKLVELTVELSVLPASYRADLRRMLREKMDQRDPELLAEQCMDYLTLAVKYMSFDLEATRRENEYLRTMLENQSGS